MFEPDATIADRRAAEGTLWLVRKSFITWQGVFHTRHAVHEVKSHAVMLTGAEPQQGVVIYCFGSDFFSRMSNPVVET